jgi:hypothetical protein
MKHINQIIKSLNKSKTKNNNLPKKEFTPDSIVQKIIDKFLHRAEFGKKKYGTDLDRSDLNIETWSNHLSEELQDGILYLEKFRQEYEKLNKLLKLSLEIIEKVNSHDCNDIFVNGDDDYVLDYIIYKYHKNIDLREFWNLKYWYEEERKKTSN